jgi:hypothetical protein
LALQVDELVEIASNARLVGMRRITHRVAERETRFALLTLDAPSLCFEPLIDRHEAVHLCVGETDTTARDLIEHLPKAALELCAIA